MVDKTNKEKELIEKLKYEFLLSLTKKIPYFILAIMIFILQIILILIEWRLYG